jgi:hypothetical protein
MLISRASCFICDMRSAPPGQDRQASGKAGTEKGGSIPEEQGTGSAPHRSRALHTTRNKAALGDFRPQRTTPWTEGMQRRADKDKGLANAVPPAR